MDLLMQRISAILGRLLFPHHQDWAQRRHAKTVVLTVVFALALGLAVVAVIRMMYDRK
jgi:hypothetical protein